MDNMNRLSEAYLTCHQSTILPVEILYMIFMKLSITSLCRASQVCREWYLLSLEESNWKQRYDKLWTLVDFENMIRKSRNKLTTDEKSSSTWRERYGVMYKCTFIWKTPYTLYDEAQSQLQKEEKRQRSVPLPTTAATSRASVNVNVNVNITQENQESAGEDQTLNIVPLFIAKTNELSSSVRLTDEEELQLALALSLYFH
eukprot:TRINITY_DN6323_c0_g1_i1.p1 TRINITY_DN6323_c0_g1~~TRINITY_DN6323_c0_g1_i1.p1  ORF type:complete len:220 (-),score=38.04 TRINITY_DN6323_c0_g1_i1:46-648(-)